MSINPKLSLRAAVIISLLLMGAFLWAYHVWDERERGNPNSAKILTKSDYLELQRASARATLAAAITNDVVGWQRTIQQSALINGDDWQKWTATATVEYVNSFGGITRTNLYWLFKPSGREAYAVFISQTEYLAALR